MNDSTIEITTIKVKLADKEIELTLDDAKKLREVLNDLFAVKIEKEYVPAPNTIPYQPIWIIPPQDHNPWWTGPTITCGVENKTLSITC